jgi:lysine 6-dehydrogenase
MPMRMLVLGSGLQGSACAFDLLNNPDVTEVRLADQRVDALPPFLAPHVGGRLTPTPLDARDEAAVARVMVGCDAAMSALPYYFNDTMAKLALDAGLHFCDLGGNTDIVMRQRLLDRQARSRGVSIVPDCGLAPGMVNILAQHGIEQLDEVDAVRLYVGGLPQQPTPPLNYQVVYSLEGVLDYYTTKSWVLRDSKLTNVTALSEIEHIDFPAPLGTLEAFHTAGGLSTMAFRYEGKIPTMEYKTLRYPGHARIMETIRDLGFLDLEPVKAGGAEVRPRDVAVAVLDPRLRKPSSPDLVALRVVVEGRRGGQAARVGWQLIDRADTTRGITAMMRTTGYSLAITGLMQATGQIPAGVHTPDECVPAMPYVAALGERGIHITTLEA